MLEHDKKNDNELFDKSKNKYEEELQSLRELNKELETKLKQAESNIQSLQKQNEEIASDLRIVDNELEGIKRSTMWRFALKYYKLRDFLLPKGSVVRRFAEWLFKIFRVNSNSNSFDSTSGKAQIDELMAYGKYSRMDIIATKHVMFIAKLVQHDLQRIGIKCAIHIVEPKVYEDIPYIIICPQFVKHFPKVYFVIQMEQTVSSRWFSQEYYECLRNSCGVLDYSLENIAYFNMQKEKNKEKDISGKVYYLPVDYLPGYCGLNSNEEKEYDVLFYGDPKSKRRQDVLNELSNKFNVKICTELFGEQLYEEIRKAKIVVNIHYYDDALLETTRLFEVLSLNSSIIVSEDSKDTEEMLRLHDYVDFVPRDNVNALAERIEYWLKHDQERKKKLDSNYNLLEKKSSSFSFYFYRFLLAYDRISFDEFYDLEKNYVTLNTNRICLNIREATERRKSFERDNRYEFEVFPGLRHRMGWIGCGLSYKFIAKKALESEFENVIVCEDDVIFPQDFTERLIEISDYLTDKEWSVYSGLMADVDKANIMSYEKYNTHNYLLVDRMVSMVMNLYNEDALKLIATWDEQNRDVGKNTIDRYLEGKKLNVFVGLPYLVGHKEELDSTIWGFNNIQYRELISSSQKKLEDKLQKFIARA